MKKITLANAADTYHFYRRMPLRMTESGSFVPERWYHRLWSRVTSPFRRQYIVVDINPAAGSITTCEDRKWYRFL